MARNELIDIYQMKLDSVDQVTSKDMAGLVSGLYFDLKMFIKHGDRVTDNAQIAQMQKTCENKTKAMFEPQPINRSELGQHNLNILVDIDQLETERIEDLAI